MRRFFHQDFKKEILVAVMGLTPQIITEIIYFLSQKRIPPIFINEIYVITTKTGKREILEKLLDKRTGQFYRFCKEYILDAKRIKFDESTIMVIDDGRGHPLDDIRTSGESEILANRIFSLMKKLTKDPHSRLHCSIAGGRKTMGLYMGFAIQMLGREWDTLSHVLIKPPELESHSDFYYPPKIPTKIEVKDKSGKIKEICTSRASIDLAEIPFIHMGNKLLKILDRRNFRKAVKGAQQEIDSFPVPLPMIVNTELRRLIIGQTNIDLSPLEMAIYLYYIRNKIERCTQMKRKKCYGCYDCFRTVLQTEEKKQEIIEDAKQLSASAGFFKSSWKVDPKNTFRSQISKLNKKISNAFAQAPVPHFEEIAEFYMILPARRGYGDTRYGIRIDRKKIRMVSATS